MNDQTCSVDQCTRDDIKSRGMCHMHYFRWYRLGETGEATPRRRATRGRCSVEGCGLVDCGPCGLCEMHAARLKRQGATGEATRRKGEYDTTLYGGAHQRIYRARGAASQFPCAHCTHAADHWAYDHEDADEMTDPVRGSAYSLDPMHYIPLCASCHKVFDLRAA